MLTFLHLSDIHFSNFDGPTGQHLDDRVRDLMLEDIKRMRDRVGPMDAILVVGDVANSGQEGEYALAADFLDRTATLIECEPDQVACVPGNHDVDRGAQDPVHSAVRRCLRAVSPEEVSFRIQDLLASVRGQEVMLDPLAAYNRFALQYSCAIDADHPVWSPKLFEFGEREVLIHGATSAWICDASDSDQTDERKVVAGDFQCWQIAPDAEGVAIAMIHHPGNWLRDTQLVKPWLNRAQVILTGHEHASGIQEDADEHRWVVIASGATNPERTKRGWVPAYNVLQIELSEDGADLEVRIFVRSWRTGVVAEFASDPRFGDPHAVTVRLDRHRRDGDEEQEPVLPETPEEVEPQEPEPIQSADHTLVFEIMRAPPDARHRAARALGLVTQEELGGLSLDREILTEARKQGRLTELKERIEDE